MRANAHANLNTAHKIETKIIITHFAIQLVAKAAEATVVTNAGAADEVIIVSKMVKIVETNVVATLMVILLQLVLTVLKKTIWPNVSMTNVSPKANASLVAAPNTGQKSVHSQKTPKLRGLQPS